MEAEAPVSSHAQFHITGRCSGSSRNTGHAGGRARDVKPAVHGAHAAAGSLSVVPSYVHGAHGTQLFEPGASQLLAAYCEATARVVSSVAFASTWCGCRWLGIPPDLPRLWRCQWLRFFTGARPAGALCAACGACTSASSSAALARFLVKIAVESRFSISGSSPQTNKIFIKLGRINSKNRSLVTAMETPYFCCRDPEIRVSVESGFLISSAPPQACHVFIDTSSMEHRQNLFD